MPLSTEKKRLRPLVFRTSGQVVVAGPASPPAFDPKETCALCLPLGGTEFVRDKDSCRI
jgi:hypothetical protein